MYNVKLEQFEGPLDLLYSLIDERKMDITGLSLAMVADQYLEHINNEKNIDLENLTYFLTIASKLILIKSKAILPTLDFSEEEESEMRDLEWQLREYKKFKDISEVIKKNFLASKQSFVREKFFGFKAVFYPPESINIFDLKKHFLAVIEQIPIVEKLEEEIVKEIITLEEKIEHLHRHILEKVESSFSLVVVEAQDKIEIIVSFLAMLEMVKQRIIEVEQFSLFDEIKMKKMANEQNE